MFKLGKSEIVILNVTLVPALFCVWLVALLLSTILDSAFSSCAILPLAYLLGYCFFLYIKKESVSDIHIIILFLFFIKLYLLPILVMCNGGFDLQEYNPDIENNLFDGVMIQVVAWLATTIALSFFKIEKRNIDEFDKYDDIAVNKKIWGIIGICSLIIIIAIIIFPSLLYRFRPLFFLSEEQEAIWKQNSTIAHDTIPKLIYYPINWLITITRLALVYMLVILIWKKSKGKHEILSIFLSFVVIGFGLVLFVPDDVAASILSAVVLFILTTKLYPKKRRLVLTIMLVAGGLLFFYMFFGRALLSHSDLSNTFEKLAKRLNAYFSGFINASAVFEMECDDKLAYFGGDFLRSLPVLKGFFKTMPTTTELFNIALGYDPIYNSQIIPLEGQAYFYLNYAGVIIAPILVVKVCFHFYNKMQKSSGSFEYFVNCFYTLLLAFGMAMYDGFLIFYLCLSYVPLLIIKIFRRIRNVKNERTNLS